MHYIGNRVPFVTNSVTYVLLSQLKCANCGEIPEKWQYINLMVSKGEFYQCILLFKITFDMVTDIPHFAVTDCFPRTVYHLKEEEGVPAWCRSVNSVPGRILLVSKQRSITHKLFHTFSHFTFLWGI